MLDDDGYPTEETLEVISKWDDLSDQGYVDWIEYVKKVWMWPEFISVGESDNLMVRELHETLKRGPHVLKMSTGGWSGNESIISAMQDHLILWSFNLVSYRAGGHYELKWKQ